MLGNIHWLISLAVILMRAGVSGVRSSAGAHEDFEQGRDESNGKERLSFQEVATDFLYRTESMPELDMALDLMTARQTKLKVNLLTYPDVKVTEVHSSMLTLVNAVCAFQELFGSLVGIVSQGLNSANHVLTDVIHEHERLVIEDIVYHPTLKRAAFPLWNRAVLLVTGRAAYRGRQGGAERYKMIFATRAAFVATVTLERFLLFRVFGMSLSNPSLEVGDILSPVYKDSLQMVERQLNRIQHTLDDRDLTVWKKTRGREGNSLDIELVSVAVAGSVAYAVKLYWGLLDTGVIPGLEIIHASKECAIAEGSEVNQDESGALDHPGLLQEHSSASSLGFLEGGN